jgi:hypothetical protein
MPATPAQAIDPAGVAALKAVELESRSFNSLQIPNIDRLSCIPKQNYLIISNGCGGLYMDIFFSQMIIFIIDV